MKLKMLDPWKERGLKTVEDLKRNYPAKTAMRWTKDDNGRTLPLTSAAWRKLRRYVLAGEPLCRHCTARGLTVPATDVDHRDNDPSNNDLVNLVPLCHSCHSRKTNIDMGHKVSLGCDATGHPADPNHHWNKPSLGRPGASALPSCAVPAEKSTATDGHIPTGSHHVNANCKDYP